MRLPAQTICGVLLYAASAVLATPPASQPAGPTDARLRALVEELNNRSFRVREQATDELSRLDFEQVDRLTPLFRSAAGPEQKMRIKRAVQRMFLSARAAGRIPEGFIGVQHAQISGENSGLKTPTVLVTAVVPDSPAEKAGMQNADVIVGLNGQPLDDRPGQQFADRVRTFKPGDEVRLSVIRDGRKLDVKVKLAARAGFAVARDNLAEDLAQFTVFWHDRFDASDPILTAAEVQLGPGINEFEFGGGWRRVRAGEDFFADDD